jgi:hypothetical protein
MVLDFIIMYAVKRARTPITITASVVNASSVNPRAAEAGTRLVELLVIELVAV